MKWNDRADLGLTTNFLDFLFFVPVCCSLLMCLCLLLVLFFSGWGLTPRVWCGESGTSWAPVGSYHYPPSPPPKKTPRNKSKYGFVTQLLIMATWVLSQGLGGLDRRIQSCWGVFELREDLWPSSGYVRLTHIISLLINLTSADERHCSQKVPLLQYLHECLLE